MQPRTKPLRVTRGGVFASLAVFAVAALCVRLGFWQLDRRALKQAANDVLHARQVDTPLTIRGLLGDTTGLRFRRAVAAGSWDGERTIVLPGRAYRGVPGAHVLTPLVLEDGSAILVNRGWAPAADAASVDPALFIVDGSVTTEGMIDGFPGADASLAPRAGTVAPQVEFRRVWYAIDETRLREQFPYRLADATLRLTPAATDTGFPVRLEPPVLDAGPHLGYAIQWFSFAAIAIIGWSVMVARNRSGRNP